MQEFGKYNENMKLMAFLINPTIDPFSAWIDKGFDKGEHSYLFFKPTNVEK